MKLTDTQVRKTINLEQAWSDYLASTRTAAGAGLGLDYQSGKWREKLRDDEESPQCKDLKEFLRGLSDSEFRELKVFMWIGRGEYKPAKFQELYEETCMAANREEDVFYMIEKMEAANYLRDGFGKLNVARMI